MSDQLLGGVTVEVKAKLEPLEQGLSNAGAQTNKFDQDARAAMGRVEGASNKMASTLEANAKRAAVAQGAPTKAYEAVTAAEKKVGDQAKTTADVQAASAKRAADAQIAEAKRVADQQAALARGDIRREVAPNGSVSFVPNFGRPGGAAPPAAPPTPPPVTRALAEQAQAAAATALGADQAALALGRMGVAGRVAGVALTTLGGPLAALLAITVGLTVAADHYSTELQRLDNIARGVGATAGFTGAQLQELALDGAKAGGTTVGQAKAMATELARTGQVGGKVFSGLIASQKAYAAATGMDLKAARSELVSMFVDPAAGADMLQAKFGRLTDAQRQNIKTLAEHGDKTGAQAALLAALGVSLDGVSGKLGGLKGAWDGVASGTSRAVDLLGEYIVKAQILATLGPQGLAMQQRMEADAREQQKRASQFALDNRAASAGVDTARGLDPDFAARRNLDNQRAVIERGVQGAASTGQIDALREMAPAYNNVIRAQATFLTQSEREHQLAQLQVRENQVRSQQETAATRAKLGEIAAQRVRIQLAGQVISTGEVEQRAQDAATAASSRASRQSNSHAEALAREAAAMEASARGALKVADAYLVGTAAAQKAEAQRKAETQATRKGIDVDAQARRQLALDLAEQAAGGAKVVAQTREQTAAQQMANVAMREGAIGSGEMQRFISQELTLRPLLAAASKAEGAAKETLLKVIRALEEAYRNLNEVEAEGLLSAQHKEAQDTIERLELEAKLVGALNVQRDRELAMLAKRQELMRQGGRALVDSNDGQRAIRDAGKVADAGNTTDAAVFVQRQTEAIHAQVAAYQQQASVLGMTHKAAAAYLKEQQLLEDAARRGITLSDTQRAHLHDLAGGYGEATDGARKLAEAQRAAADAANFWADETQAAIETVLSGGSGKRAIAKIFTDVAKARLTGFLTGTGPLAGQMGTDKTAGPGQPNGGVLSQLFGKAFGVGAAGAPTGAANNPFYVMPASGGLAGMLGAGKSENDNDPIGALIEKAGGAFGPNSGEGLTNIGKDGQPESPGNFLERMAGIFKENTEGGFLGKFKGLFGSIGSILGGSGSGGVGGLVQQGVSLLASVLHDGTSGASQTRAAPASLFLRAPRLHDGLAPDEFAAILQTGEQVKSRREVAADRQGRGKAPVVMHVHTKDADSFRRSERQIAQRLNRRLRSA